MAEPFVSGYLTELTIDSVVHSVWTNTAGLDMSQTVLPKPVFGDRFPSKIVAQQDATLDSTGHISPAAAAALDAARLSQTAVAYIMQIGEVGGNDAGSYAGNGLVASLAINADAEGQVQFSMTIECTDDPAYTAAP